MGKKGLLSIVEGCRWAFIHCSLRKDKLKFTRASLTCGGLLLNRMWWPFLHGPYMDEGWCYGSHIISVLMRTLR